MWNRGKAREKERAESKRSTGRAFGGGFWVSLGFNDAFRFVCPDEGMRKGGTGANAHASASSDGSAHACLSFVIALDRVTALLVVSRCTNNRLVLPSRRFSLLLVIRIFLLSPCGGDSFTSHLTGTRGKHVKAGGIDAIKHTHSLTPLHMTQMLANRPAPPSAHDDAEASAFSFFSPPSSFLTGAAAAATGAGAGAGALRSSTSNPARRASLSAALASSLTVHLSSFSILRSTFLLDPSCSLSCRRCSSSALISSSCQ